MSSITTWTRLEPRHRTGDMSIGAQARIYDPLWLLTRQWQMGEFQGDDSGSPAAARWQGDVAQCSRYYPGRLANQGTADGQPFDSQTVPLETLVERESVRTQGALAEKLRFAAEAGQQFLRMLEQKTLSKSYRDFFKGKYAFVPLTASDRAALDGDSLSFLNLVMARVPDGRRIYTAMRIALRPVPPTKAALPRDFFPIIAQADGAEVQLAAEQWLQWYESVFSEPQGVNPAWFPDRMEYGFSLAARLGQGERVLTAPEYYSGRTDWHDFNLNPGASLRASGDPASTVLTRTTIPAPVTYRGMPAARFWEFEDARVDFGAISADPEDLARLLLIEFAMVYGNDWFVIPIDLPVGCLCRTNTLVITNTFGDRTLIRPSSDLAGSAAAWRMFQLSGVRTSGQATVVPDGNLFFLAPAVMQSLESRAIEEVLFLRDEMANMAWGVERVIESPTERPLNRFEQPPESASADASGNAIAPSREALIYRLATAVPDYWVPLLPVQSPTGLRLKRGAVLKPNAPPERVQARGRILNPEPASADGLAIYEEEVPREGIRVTRHYQLARWMDGSTHLWVGRRKTVGRGEGSSGLQFDTIDP